MGRCVCDTTIDCVYTGFGRPGTGRVSQNWSGTRIGLLDSKRETAMTVREKIEKVLFLTMAERRRGRGTAARVKTLFFENLSGVKRYTTVSSRTILGDARLSQILVLWLCRPRRPRLKRLQFKRHERTCDNNVAVVASAAAAERRPAAADKRAHHAHTHARTLHTHIHTSARAPHTYTLTRVHGPHTRTRRRNSSNGGLDDSMTTASNEAAHP